MNTLLFLDIDEVLCLSAPYGGRHLTLAQPPADLWQRLFSSSAVEVLNAVLEEHSPAVVLTTSWLQLLDKRGFEAVFARTGLSAVSKALHPSWDAPQNRGATRLQAIEAWLARNPPQDALVVIDDAESGTGLRGSHLDKKHQVVLCEVGRGLQQGHLLPIRRALRGKA